MDRAVRIYQDRRRRAIARRRRHWGGCAQDPSGVGETLPVSTGRGRRGGWAPPWEGVAVGDGTTPAVPAVPERRGAGLAGLPAAATAAAGADPGAAGRDSGGRVKIRERGTRAGAAVGPCRGVPVDRPGNDRPPGRNAYHGERDQAGEPELSAGRPSVHRQHRRLRQRGGLPGLRPDRGRRGDGGRRRRDRCAGNPSPGFLGLRACLVGACRTGGRRGWHDQPDGFVRGRPRPTKGI